MATVHVHISKDNQQYTKQKRTQMSAFFIAYIDLSLEQKYLLEHRNLRIYLIVNIYLIC